MPEKDDKISWYSFLRYATPTLLVIVLAYVANMNEKVGAIDDKIFKHLTNDEIHAPRSIYVERTQFDLYQKMRDRQMESYEAVINEIKVMIGELRCDLGKKK